MNPIRSSANLFDRYIIGNRNRLSASLQKKQIVRKTSNGMKKLGAFFAGALLSLAFLAAPQLTYGAQVPRHVIDEAMSYIESDYLLYDKTTPEACRDDIEAMLSWKLAYEQGENPGTFSHEVTCFDKFSGVLTPRETRERSIQIAGSFGGIGFSFRKESPDSNRPLVKEVFEGNPGEKAGMKAGDILLRARDEGEEMFVDLSFQSAPEKLRGRVGSKVYLVIEREGVEIILPVITRQVIVIKSVKAKVFHGFGYVSVSSFTGETPHELYRALLTFEAQGISRVAIDLRDNGGGLLVAATEMLYSFSSDPRDIVFTTRSRHNEVVSSIRLPVEECQWVRPPCLPFGYPGTYQAKLPGRFKNLTIAILINERSASASEVFAGTIKDWQKKGLKAMIVGTNSLGKGIVQTVIPLGDGYSLSETTAEYLVGNAKTPVHHIGVTPDYIVEDTRRFSEDMHETEDTLTDKDEQFLAVVFALFLLSPVR